MLEGKLIPLKKPLIVTQKVPRSKRRDSAAMEVDGAKEDEDEDGDEAPVLQVLGVIRHKFHFKTRPAPIIRQAQVENV